MRTTWSMVCGKFGTDDACSLARADLCLRVDGKQRTKAAWLSSLPVELTFAVPGAKWRDVVRAGRAAIRLMGGHREIVAYNQHVIEEAERKKK